MSTKSRSGQTSLLAVSFIDANNGMVVGETRFLRTTNGGVNWNVISPWYSQISGVTVRLSAVSFTDANFGTAVGGNGTILRTTNKGVNWIPQTSGTTNPLTGVSFTDANTGTAVGYNSTILRTTNGGVNWQAQSPGTSCDLNAVFFVDANTGTAVGWEIILRTTNGGESWISQTSAAYADIYAVHFVDANTGTVVGEVGQIYHTTNGGVVWVSQSGITSYGLYDVFFVNANTGTAVGDGTRIIRTTNGGVDWYLQPNPLTSGYYNSVSFIDANTGTLVGLGQIRHTTNGGVNWNWQFDTAKGVGVADYHGIFLTDANNGTIVGGGNGGIILRQNNLTPAPLAPTLISPANNSTYQSLTPTLNWSAVSGTSSYRVQVSTDSAFGSTIIDSSGIIPDSMMVPNSRLQLWEKYYWRVNAVNTGGTGPWSIIWNFTPGTVGSAKNNSEIPRIFKLCENYPNPFNPVTTIKFEIPKVSNVKLIVYNLVGQVVQTLVEGKLEGGKYSCKWDASGFASGIYIYSLIAENKRIDTKKMVLVK